MIGSGPAAVGEIHVYPSGTLAGTGSVIGVLRNLGGTISPGHSPGTLTGDQIILTSGTLDMEIAGTAPGSYDMLAATNSLSLGGTLNLIFTDGFAPQTGDAFLLFTAPGGPTGAFDEIHVMGIQSGWQYELTSVSGGLELHSLSDATVPEPYGLAVLLLAAGALLRPGRIGKQDDSH